MEETLDRRFLERTTELADRLLKEFPEIETMGMTFSWKPGFERMPAGNLRCPDNRFSALSAYIRQLVKYTNEIVRLWLGLANEAVKRQEGGPDVDPKRI